MTKKYDLGFHVSWAIPMRGTAQVVDNFFIAIRDGEIAVAEPFKKAHKAMCKKFISAPGKVLLPGLVNAHTHLAMTLFRGLEDDVPLQTWLFHRIFPLEAEFVSAPFVRTGTELAALECIRFGTTTVADMYYFANESMKVWDKAGLRGVFSQPVMNFPLPEDKALAGSMWDRFEKNLALAKKNSRLKFAIAPHAPYTCSDEILSRAAELSEKFQVPLHIHLSESAHEEPDSQKQFQKSQVKRLSDIGVLGPRTLCAHSVHLSEKDREILAQSKASVVHNPDSNLKLGSGVAPVVDYLKRGINVALGTDGSASANDLSLFGAMDLATKVQKLSNSDNTAMIAAQALWMATMGGAKALGLDAEIGSLEVGKRADFILVDFDFPHLQPVHDPISHLVYSCQGLEVDTVICDGRILMKDKKFLTLSAKSVFAKAQKYRSLMRKSVAKLKAQEALK